MLVPEPRAVRASDAERERIVRALRDGAATGRLDPEELERRLERAYAAELRADLVPLVADLPDPAGRALPGRRPPRRLPAVPPVVAVAVLLIAIWALTGAGYFWPVWPIVAMAFGAFKGTARCGMARPPGLARR